METSMQNRICLVTGATSGMGQATAAALAHQRATVLLVARDPRKGKTVCEAIRAASGNPQVDVLVADLASLQAVRTLAATVRQQYPQIHVLINNAGGIFFTRETTVDGYEMTLAVNYLAPFLLTNLLRDRLQASAPARIINISSSVARIGRITFGDLQREHHYSGLAAYGQAKLATLLFTHALARRLAGTGVTVNAVAPGPVATNFAKNGHSIMNRVLPLLFRFATSPEAGAHTAITLASASQFAEVTGQVLYRGHDVHVARADDVALQERLWQVSATLTDLPVTTA